MFLQLQLVNLCRTQFGTFPKLTVTGPRPAVRQYSKPKANRGTHRHQHWDLYTKGIWPPFTHQSAWCHQNTWHLPWCHPTFGFNKRHQKSPEQFVTAEPLVTRGQRGKLGVLRTTHCIAPSDTASAIASASASASANVPGNLVCSLPLPRVTLLVRPAGLPGMRKVSTPLVDQHQLLQHKLQTE